MIAVVAVGNAVAAVASALLPGAVLGARVGAKLLPSAPLFALLDAPLLLGALNLNMPLR